MYNNPILKPVLNLIFNQPVPLAPFPEVERCLGLASKDSEMRIFEGYAVLAYDYKVDKAQDCLFDMKDTLAQKELRMLKKTGFESKG